MTRAAASAPHLRPLKSFTGSRRAINPEAAAIYRDLAQWLEQRPGPHDPASVPIALLEAALDRCSAEHTNAASAKLLSETLKLLETLPGQVPDHLVSPEEIDSASEILPLLAGWFAAGIGGPPCGEDISAAGGLP
jgi:hypothetical protein